jgi:hypothetical protein
MDTFTKAKRNSVTEAPGSRSKSSPAKTVLATASDREKVIGHYASPTGYYERTKAMPFLGRITCRTRKIVAGSWQEIILDYEVGASGLADGAWIKATFKFYSDWALFQTSDPKAANYVTAEYQAGPLLPEQEPATVQSLSCRFDQKGHERPYQKAVIVDIVDGYLNPGGTRALGAPGRACRPLSKRTFVSAVTSIRSELPASLQSRMTWCSR